VINAIKFSIEEIEASEQYFDHTPNTHGEAFRSIAQLSHSARVRLGGSDGHECPLRRP
jgi:hypothetical protein